MLSSCGRRLQSRELAPDGSTCANAKASFGADFNEMLAVAVSCAGSSLTIYSVDETNAFSGFGDDPETIERRTKVHLARFREWAEGKGYTLPGRFPRGMKVPDPARPAQPEKAEVTEQVPSPSKWPWGSYETKLLTELAEAARHFWTEYKSGFPATAPTNDEVRDWLMRRGVPQRKAEVMAQILRADDMPPGPHVNK